MFCSQCGASISGDARFCRACGKSIDADGDVEVLTLATRPTVPPPGGAAPLPPTVNEAARYAGFWRRVAASVLDGLLLAGLAIVLVAVLGVLLLSGQPSDEKTGMLAVFYYLGSWIVGWLYFAFTHSSARQASPGKRAFKIKVTDLAGGRISFARASGRYLAYLLVCTFTLGIGLLMAGFTRRRQALHDLVAGTLVVTREATTSDVQAGLGAPRVSGAVIAVALVIGLIPLVGILAAIAIPAYQDYLVRSQVTEGLMLAGPVKVTVAEAYANGTDFGDMDGTALGLAPATGKYVERVQLTGGVVEITYGRQASALLQGKTVLLVPAVTVDEAVVWVCGRASAPDDAETVYDNYAEYTDVEPKYLPSACR